MIIGAVADHGNAAVEAVVTLELPDHPRSASRAREAVHQLHGCAHPETLAKARLLITELVAAAVAEDGAGTLSIQLTVREGRIRGELATERRGAARPSGMALFLVRRMAEDWGVTTTGTAWFTVVDRPRRFVRRPAAIPGVAQ
jgi:hypothetical protein